MSYKQVLDSSHHEVAHCGLDVFGRKHDSKISRIYFGKRTGTVMLASGFPHSSLPQAISMEGLPKPQEAALDADQSYGLPACPSRSQSYFGYQCPDVALEDIFAG